MIFYALIIKYLDVMPRNFSIGEFCKWAKTEKTAPCGAVFLFPIGDLCYQPVFWV